MSTRPNLPRLSRHLPVQLHSRLRRIQHLACFPPSLLRLNKQPPAQLHPRTRTDQPPKNSSPRLPRLSRQSHVLLHPQIRTDQHTTLMFPELYHQQSLFSIGHSQLSLTTNMSHDNRLVASQIHDQYHEFKRQVHAQPPSLHTSQTSHPSQHIHALEVDEDLDMDAQLENVSPDRGGSSLQISSERDVIQADQVNVHKPTHIIASTPPPMSLRNPRIEDTSESHSTKQRKADDYTATSTPVIPSKAILPPSHTRAKQRPTLGIDMSSHVARFSHGRVISHTKR